MSVIVPLLVQSIQQMFFHLLWEVCCTSLNCMSFWLWHCCVKYKCCFFVHLLQCLSVYVILLLALLFPSRNPHFVNRKVFSNFICNALSPFISLIRCFLLRFNWNFLATEVFMFTLLKPFVFFVAFLCDFIISIA